MKCFVAKTNSKNEKDKDLISSEFQKYIRSKEFKELLEKYRESIDSGECRFIDSDDLLDIAEYFHLKKHTDKAVEAAEYCLHLYPDNDKAKVFIASVYMLNENYDGARKIIESVNDDNNINVAYLKAELMMYDMKYDDVEVFLLGVLESVRNGEISFLDDNDDEGVLMDYTIDVAMLYCDYQQWDRAEEWLDRTGPVDDGVAMADYIMAKARVKTAKGELKEAVRLWNKYIDEDAYSSMAWVQLAQCQYQLGDCSEALKSAQYAETISPDFAETYISEGSSLFALGHYEEAVEKYQKFLQLVPGDVQAELLTASTLFAMKRYEEASEHILNAVGEMERMIAEDEVNVPDVIGSEVFRQAAYIFAALQRVDEALYYADRLLLYGVPDVKHQLLRAAILLESGQVKKAFSLFEETLKGAGHDPEVYIMVGCMLVDANVIESGYNLLSQTLKIIAESGGEKYLGYDRLAYASLAMEHYDEFLDALKISAKYMPLETVSIFSSLFPEGMPVTEYVDYAKTHVVSLPND